MRGPRIVHVQFGLQREFGVNQATHKAFNGCLDGYTAFCNATTLENFSVRGWGRRDCKKAMRLWKKQKIKIKKMVSLRILAPQLAAFSL